MTKLSELKKESKLKMLVYGDAGTGKTSFSLSAPGPIYVFDFDNKAISAANILSPEAQEQIEVKQYGVTSKEPVPFIRFVKDFNELQNNLDQYKTIVIDSLTLFAERLMEYCMHSNPGSNRSKIGKVQTPNLKDYGNGTNFFKSTITEILSTPLNVIFTGHYEQAKDDQTGQIMYVPLIWGNKLAKWLPIVMHEVYFSYLDSKKTTNQFMMHTRGTSRMMARSQVKNLPPTMELSFKELEKYL